MPIRFFILTFAALHAGAVSPVRSPGIDDASGPGTIVRLDR